MASRVPVRASLSLSFPRSEFRLPNFAFPVPHSAFCLHPEANPVYRGGAIVVQGSEVRWGSVPFVRSEPIGRKALVQI